jgi:integrase
MPANTEIEQRNRALIAFTLLTGARDRAIASMSLKHVDLAEGSVYQDAREVSAKFRKTFTTHFFPVGDEIRAIVDEWVNHLRNERLWGNDDPLFPATRIAVGSTHHFEAAGLDRKHWRTASPIRGIFRKAFKQAGLSYFIPHSFRTTLLQFGEMRC